MKPALPSLFAGKLLGLFFIVGMTALIYAPVLHGAWQWDDLPYYGKNALRDDPGWLWKIWFLPGSQVEYYPITETVQAVQWKIWGNATPGYHLTSLVLHIIDALLVWWLLGKLGLQYAWLGGALFAIHPGMVESVAWLAELKNTLSLAPFLLAMGCWIDYERDRRTRDYLLALLFFTIAMGCKISMTTFPFVILLYAWYRRGRIAGSDWRASAPFFAISLAMGCLTILAGYRYREWQGMPPDAIDMGSPLAQAALGGETSLFYLRKIFYPGDSLPLYPRWTVDPWSLRAWVPWLIIIGLLAWFWMQRKSWGRHALLGFGFFLILLAPFTGVHGGTFMNVTWVMDHFLYIPILGVLGLVVAGVEMAAKSSRPFTRGGIHAALAVALILLAMKSFSYARLWASPAALWAHTSEKNPDAWLTHYNLAGALMEQGRTAEAMAQYQEAARLNPRLALVHFNLASIASAQGLWAEAVAEYQTTLEIDPGNIPARSNLAVALIEAGRPDEALAQFAEAVRREPANAELHRNYGVALDVAGRKAEAREQFALALRLNPNDLVARESFLRLASPTGGQK